MPTYDYECDACGHAFEEFQQMSDKLLRTCPKCKRRKLRRLIGAGAAVIFKGSGFYQTDYRSADYNAKAKADKPDDTSSAKPKSDSTDKKASAPKSEAKTKKDSK